MKKRNNYKHQCQRSNYSIDGELEFEIKVPVSPKVMLLYIFACLLYGTTQLSMSIITKLNDKLYDYSPVFVTLFYMYVFFPINLARYAYNYKISELKQILSVKDFLELSIGAAVYITENVATYWILLYVPVSFYIIGRTSTAFINVLFSKYYLKKEIFTSYYYGLACLIVSYILFLIAYTKTDLGTNQIIAIALTFGTSLTSAFYNNMTERFFDKKKYEDMNQIWLIYQIVFNMYGFLILMPICLYISINHHDFTSEIGPNVLYSITGFLCQIYLMFKVMILSSEYYSGNQILTVIDLLRRVTTNIIAYFFFNEFWNTEVIMANIFMVFGCCFIGFSVFQYRSKI